MLYEDECFFIDYSNGSVTAASHEAGKRVTLLKSDGGTLYLTR